MAWTRAWGVGVAAMLVLGTAPQAETLKPARLERHDARADGLHRRLSSLMRQTRSASWVQTTWERKGGEEQQVRSRLLWSAEGIVRVDVEGGRGKGAKLVRRGEQVTIKPPGIFGAFKLRRSVDDNLVRSLRGRDLRSPGFIADLEHVLEHWGTVQLDFLGDQAVLRYVNASDLPSAMAIGLESLAPRVIESRENGVLVERITFENVRFDVPLDPDQLKP